MNKVVNSCKHSPVMLICWGIVGLLGMYFASLSPEEFFIRFGIGDALVYSRVAFNVATGKGSTYNLLVPTNGYHPLWMWLHIPLMLSADNILSRLWLVEKLWITIALSATFAWSALIRHITHSDLAGGLTALLFGASGWSLYVLYSGIETPLVLLGLALVFYAANRLRGTKEHTLFFLFAYVFAAALTFLARLDSVFILLPTLLIVFPVLSRISYVKILAAFVCGGILVIPYFIWNWIVIGHVMPVSGMVKTVSEISVARSLSMIEGWIVRVNKLGVPVLLLYGIAIGLGCIALVLFRLLYRKNRTFSRILAVSLIGAVVHYGYYLLFMKEIHVSWHMYPQFLAAYVIVIGVQVLYEQRLSRVIKHTRFYHLACMIFFLFLTAGITLVTIKYHNIKRVRRSEYTVVFEMGRWIRDNLPIHAKIAMYDSFVPAIMAPHHSFVDLNGLVENLEGSRMIRQGSPLSLIQLRNCEYLIEREIDMASHSISNTHEPGLLLASFSGTTPIYNFRYKLYRVYP